WDKHNTPIEKFKELQLFRIAQEAIKNALHHSGATLISISLEQENGLMKFKVEDNGRGMMVSDLKLSKGLGMKNIQSRAKIINADLSVFSEPDKGVSIILMF
ncbi:MAG: hypothetical protein JEZ03_08895, partial [Bacteroidales bacterium]|nr:hypothetical protein [Bacteroidales bacterium]